LIRYTAYGDTDGVIESTLFSGGLAIFPMTFEIICLDTMYRFPTNIDRRNALTGRSSLRLSSIYLTALRNIGTAIIFTLALSILQAIPFCCFLRALKGVRSRLGPAISFVLMILWAGQPLNLSKVNIAYSNVLNADCSGIFFNCSKP
jgi:hypothetical protein